MDDFELLRQIAEYRAVVIDDSPLARDVLTYTLRSLGIGQVSTVSRISDARRKLQTQDYDIVLCDYHFGESESTGQDLLEEVRAQALLPLSSIFIMVTGEASYEKVVEVAETAPDDYLLKPFTPDALLQRLMSIAHRKLWLSPIYVALATGGDHQALAAAEKLVLEGGPHLMFAVRFAAELCARLGNHERARELYSEVVASRAAPWAKIGLARTDRAAGRIAAARGSLTAMIEEHPYYVDAYDTLGHVMEESGDLDQALVVYRNALGVTPSSVRRLQQFGTLGFALGVLDEAETSLHKAIRLGSGSPALSPLSVVLLALLRLDNGNALDIERLRGSLQRAHDAGSEDVRLPTMLDIVGAAHALASRQPDRAVEIAERLCARILGAEFDLEIACATVALLARMGRREVDLPDVEVWLRDIGLRFACSKSAWTRLSGCARDAPDHLACLEAAHMAVNAMCNDAMCLVLDKRPLEGVRMLLKSATSHHNARLLSLIESLSNKYMTADPDSFGRMLQFSGKLKARFAA